MSKKNLIVIIPAYEPTQEFVDYAKRTAEFAEELVVVNDGSGSACDSIFSEIASIENVKFITYPENHGKGYALKEAFKYCAETKDGNCVCVTADCDGQHDIEDISRIADAVFARPEALILGARDFDLPNVPPRSKAGNRSIRRIFRLLYGINLKDTQTGLRGFTVDLAKQFCSITGNRFEFEMDMLIYSSRNSIPIVEVPIRTIYPDDPQDHTSHYKSVRDSIRIMGVVVRNLNRYILTALISGVVDVSLFYILSGIILDGRSAMNTLIATAGARVISSLVNFSLNKKYVFAGKTKGSFFRYYLLWFSQLGASYGIVYVFGNMLHLPMTLVKIVGDLILAFFSYKIQSFWVFKNK